MLLTLSRAALATSAHTRSLSTLVVAELKGGKLTQGSLSAIAAAKALAPSAKVSVLAAGGEAAVADLSCVACVDKVFVAQKPSTLAEAVAPLVKSVVDSGKYTHVLAPSTSFGKDVAPRAAALLDVGQASDIIKIVDENTFVRPFYAGNALATIKAKDAVKVLTVRETAFKPEEIATKHDVEVVPVSAEAGVQTEIVSEEMVASDLPSLTSAKRIVSGGRALKSAENFVILEELAKKIGAAVGASRAAVDAGYVSNDLQIGQTGKIVAPELYVAVGISGAIQHLAGMKDSKTIVAINKDPEAPIFQVADYGLVADLFDAVPELTKKL